MDITGAIKNSAAYALMSRDLKSGAVSHAYLVECEDEGMSDALCSLFIAELAFGRTDEQAVQRAARAGSADMIVVPEEGKDRVSVDDIRGVIRSAYYTPVELDKKIIVISKCETLNDESQNAVLKILEEPPRSVLFILKCANVKKLLPTVLSRVRRITLSPFSDEQIVELLRQEHGDDGDVYLAAALSRGYLSLAERVFCSEKPKRNYELVMSTLKGMKTSRNILTYSSLIMKKKEELGDFIDVLELVLADCMLASVGERERLRFKNAVRDIIEIASGYTARVVLALRPALERARRRLELNGNAQSVLDELLFALLEVKAKCQR